jgi:Zn-dependent protease with chaperone function
MVRKITVTVTEKSLRSVTHQMGCPPDPVSTEPLPAPGPRDVAADEQWVHHALRRALELMKRGRRLLPALLLAGGVASLRTPAGAQAPAETVGALLRQAQAEGEAARQTQDRNHRNAAKSLLERAEAMSRKELARSPQCVNCLVEIAGNYYYRATYDLGKKFDDCITVAREGLARSPNMPGLLFFEGACLHGKPDYAAAAKVLNQYLSLPGASAYVEPARQLLEASRQHFLGEWYTQGAFYQSNDSRIQWFDSKTFKPQTIFQITPEYELGLGEQAFAQMSTAAPSVSDPYVLGYLQGLTDRLVGQTPGPSFPYRVTLLDSRDVNAVTTPGHIVIYTGLLSFAESESQLAGVLSHELAHSYAHHAARRLIKTYEAKALANSIVKQIDPKTAVGQALAQVVSAVGVGLFVNAYSRAEEKEADIYGSHLLFNAGYNPTSMSKFFLSMYERQPRQPVKFLSTHPPVPDRIEYLTDYFESYPLDRELALDSQTFQQVIKSRYPGLPR